MVYKYKLPYEKLLKAYFDCRRHKRATRNAIEFEISLSQNLYLLHKELINGTYAIGQSTVFIVNQPVKREIFAASFRDRIIHHLLINRILPDLEAKVFIDDSYACRVKKGTLYGVKRLYNKISCLSAKDKQDTYIAKFDLQGFFMSINKNILYNKLVLFMKTKIKWENSDEYEFYHDIMKKIVYHCPQKNCIFKSSKTEWSTLPKDKSLFYCDDFHGLPIGNLSSQIFANFYLSDFDKIMEKRFKGFYGRYVDDFYIIHNDKSDILAMIPKMREFLYKYFEVKLHKKKIYIQHYTKGIKFIGSIVLPHRTYVSNRTIGNFYKKLQKAKLEDLTKRFNPIKYLNSFNSFLGFMRPHKTYNIRKKILNNSDFTTFIRKYYKISSNYKKLSLKKNI